MYNKAPLKYGDRHSALTGQIWRCTKREQHSPTRSLTQIWTYWYYSLISTVSPFLSLNLMGPQDDTVFITLQKTLGSNFASLGGKYVWYMLYKSMKGTRDGKPFCISSMTLVMPEHSSCDRIEPPSNWWSTIFWFCLIHRMKFVPCKDEYTEIICNNINLFMNGK
jgi:hypothetical protein